MFDKNSKIAGKKRIAIIQDQLLTKGGSERVFKYLAEEFQEADLFTLCYNRQTTISGLQSHRIHVHKYGQIIRNHTVFRWLFPISTILMEMWDFSGYDIIITSSASTAKYIKNFSGIHFCYCYYPTRALWEGDKYFLGNNFFKRWLIDRFIRPLRSRDCQAAKRVDKFIAISKTSQIAIKKYYGADSVVVYPPVDTRFYNRFATKLKGNFYLIVSRLERWKMLEYAIDTFNRCKFNLKIIGKGSEESELRKRADKNIDFIGAVDDVTLAEYYASAKAVIFTPELEYGLVPLEAIASGTPVIALGRGGVLETLANAEGIVDESVCLLYANPTPKDLELAILRFENMRFSQESMFRCANRFGIDEFKTTMRALVSKND